MMCGMSLVRPHHEALIFEPASFEVVEARGEGLHAHCVDLGVRLFGVRDRRAAATVALISVANPAEPVAIRVRWNVVNGGIVTITPLNRGRASVIARERERHEAHVQP
jgi:hypothetical protein